MKKVTPKVLLISLIVVIITACAAGGSLYTYNRAKVHPNYNIDGEQPIRIYIYPQQNWEKVLSDINKRTAPKHPNDLQRLLNLTNNEHPLVGSYLIQPNETTYSLFNQLTRGTEAPLNLRFNSVRLPQHLDKVLAQQLLIDSTEVSQAFRDTALLRTNQINDTLLYYSCIPNTYQVYWTITPEDLVKRLASEYHKFWSTQRLEKAKALGLTPMQITIIASIVQEESAKTDEYPMIAGLYINRFRKGMLLQADPTVKYAVGDFTLRRILLEHLKVESPYNTYLNTGLPPTPIRIPSIAAIDGVLNAVDHDYLFMCAKADFSGYHAFAKTYQEHLVNARKYIRALNQKGIK